MPFLVENLYNILEILYFLSGPTLVIVAVFGLYQIKISKDNSRKSSKINAYKLASEKCEYYRKEIIPTLEDLDDKIIKDKVNYFDKFDSSIIHGEIKITSLKKIDKKDSQDLGNINGLLVDVLNKIESFSIPFVLGVADERAAFFSVGETLCHNVKRYLPFICNRGDLKRTNPIIKLFLLWEKRIKRQNLVNEKRKLINDKKNIEERLKEIKDEHISPIGVEE